MKLDKERETAVWEKARSFAQEVIRPQAYGYDQKGQFPREWFEQCADHGFLGTLFSVENGGSGLGYSATNRVLEELSKESCSLTAVLAAHFQAAHFLQKNGTEQQKDQYLLPAIRGKIVLTSAITEKNASSDLGNVDTVAVKVGDGWIINGNKRWVSNCAEADAIIVTAHIEGSGSHRRTGAFIIDRGAPGISMELIENKLGAKNCSNGNLRFQNCKVLESASVGSYEEDRFSISQIGVVDAMIFYAAMSVGVAQGALDRAFERVATRKVYNRPLTSYQGISFSLADMETEICAARSMLYAVSAEVDRRGYPLRKEAAMLKYFASETCCRVCDKALQLFGGDGFGEECGIARYVRDSRMLLFAAGTSEICKIIIGNEMLMKR